MREGMETATWTAGEIEEIVVMERLALYNRGWPCGAEVIRRRLQALGIHPVPSTRTIGRILARRCLTYGRTGWYEEDYA